MQYQRRAHQIQPNIDYDSFNLETVKAHLRSRGLPAEGEDRIILVERLKQEVNRAWTEYYNKLNPIGYRTQQSADEIAAQEEQRRLAREEKLRKKEENKRLAEEARLKKQQRREEAAKKQELIEAQQKIAKENRQRLEVFVLFDMKRFTEQLSLKLDPESQHIVSCNYDFTHKGFRVRFRDNESAAECSKDSTSRDPKEVEVPVKLQVLPAAVESRCMFFLDPCHDDHPNREESFAWMRKEGVESTTADTKTLNVVQRHAEIEFAKFGTIVYIFRERGFIVIQFQSEKDAESMHNEFRNGGTFHDIPFIWLRTGTPKKRDRLECAKMYKREDKKKDKKKDQEDQKERENESNAKKDENTKNEVSQSIEEKEPEPMPTPLEIMREELEKARIKEEQLRQNPNRI